MPNNQTPSLLNELGQLLAEDAAYPLEDTLLYAKLGMNYVAPSIFKDLGDHILYRDPDLETLGDALLDLWEAEVPDKRWAEIEYVVRGGKFHATFAYADEIDPDEDPFDRRDRVVARHFGKKRIVYPPPPSDAIEFKPRSNLRRPVLRGKPLS
jgi:hypothetical protein